MKTVLPLLAIGAACVVSGCADHVYLSREPGKTLREVDRPGGTVSEIPYSTGSTIVGLTYDPVKDSVYTRVSNMLAEVDRDTGAVLRRFPAQGVVAGCGQIQLAPTVELYATCGLAIRLLDHHLFLDHPSPTVPDVAEVDRDGNLVRRFQIAPNPGTWRSGLAYDERTRHLYVLYGNGTVGEFDLRGNVVRAPFALTGARIHPFGLGFNADRREFYVPIGNADAIGVFDLNGNLIDRHATSNTQFMGGVGAGPRRWTRILD